MPVGEGGWGVSCTLPEPEEAVAVGSCLAADFAVGEDVEDKGTVWDAAIR